MELIEGIPAGLAACRLNGAEAGVAALSDGRLRVRTAEPVGAIESLRLYLLDFDASAYREIAPENASLLACAPWLTGFLCDIAIDDDAWRRAARRALKDWARYIRLKLEGDDGALAAALTGCPDEPISSLTLAEQKAKWFADMPGFDARGGWTLALSLEEPIKCARFAGMGAGAYQAALLAENGLAAHPLLRRAPDRVYVGSQHCARLVPDAALLDAALLRAARDGMPVTLALPPVREAQWPWAQALLRRAAGRADEVVVNDFGLLDAARQAGFEPVLGIHLNRRRKDPRLRWKTGYAGREALLAENSLNDEGFRTWLAERGVRRFEYESCEGRVTVAPGRHSLHLPFYQTNTASGCVLAARCEGADPGRPRLDAGCPMWCRDHALIYPDWIGLVGRYNSLFGLNRAVLRDEEALRRWLDQGVDRLVLELL